MAYSRSEAKTEAKEETVEELIARLESYTHEQRIEYAKTVFKLELPITSELSILQAYPSPPTSSSTVNYVLSYFSGPAKLVGISLKVNKQFADEAAQAVIHLVSEIESDRKTENDLRPQHILEALITFKRIHKNILANKTPGELSAQLEKMIKAYNMPIDDKLFDRMQEILSHALKHLSNYNKYGYILREAPRPSSFRLSASI